jgi:hypothetical protein
VKINNARHVYNTKTHTSTEKYYQLLPYIDYCRCLFSSNNNVILKGKLLEKPKFAQLVAPLHAITGIEGEQRYSSTHS